MRNASRLFIDLIHSASGKWANWDPSIPVEVGDYGNINKESGKFERIGSIYDPVLEQYGVSLQAFQPKLAPAEEHFVCTSQDVRSLKFSAGAGVQLAGQADGSIDGQWQFGRNRGALLIISRPQIKHLPLEFPYEKLRNISVLSRKVIVMDVVICPAYALYLSQEKNEMISLTLMATGPVLPVPGMEANGGVAPTWQFNKASGLFRAATGSEYRFTPVFTLKTNKPAAFTRVRDALQTDPPVGRDILEDASPPWQNLDNDGEEDQIGD